MESTDIDEEWDRTVGDEERDYWEFEHNKENIPPADAEEDDTAMEPIPVFRPIYAAHIPGAMDYFAPKMAPITAWPAEMPTVERTLLFQQYSFLVSLASMSPDVSLTPEQVTQFEAERLLAMDFQRSQLVCACVFFNHKYGIPFYCLNH